jgi:protein phosphatase
MVAHVGDSRVYQLRENTLRQVTHDHSWVSEQVRAGVMTEKDARRHPWRNVVTRALAGGDDPDVDVAELDVRAGDRLLLCSDGLHGVVMPDRIETLVKRGKSLGDTCKTLIEAANAAGGPDNITVVMLQVDVA